MTTQESPLRSELVRPALRCKKAQAAKRHKVAGPGKAFRGPRTLQQALAQAVPQQRRRAIAQSSGYDAQAQKLTVAPYWRALLVRPLVGGTRQDLQQGMAREPL